MTNHSHQQSQLVGASDQPASETITTQTFPPLQSVSSPAVDTAAAAHYLNRRPQTLRSWACLENGPIRPIRINGRLAWRVADIKSLMEI